MRGAGVGHVVPEPVSSPGRRTTPKGEPPLVLTAGSDSSPPCPDSSLVAAVGFVPATPAQADPDIEDVKARVDRLYHEAEPAQERYTTPSSSSTELERDLAALEADQARQDEQLEGVRDQVREPVVRQYEGEGISTVGQVVVSDDPGAFLDQLSTMSSFNDLQSQLFADYATELKALDIRREATDNRADEIADDREQLASREGHGRRQARRGQGPARDLEAEEREAHASPRGSSARACPTCPPPARRRRRPATRWPRSATPTSTAPPARAPSTAPASPCWPGPQAGVGLPHSSSAQYGSGPHIAASDLQPGDLVFYYSPISHVGMYIGNGMIVHAANPGTGVAVAGLYSMPYVGAVRPG